LFAFLSDRQHDVNGMCSADLAKNCAVLAVRSLHEFSLKNGQKLSMQFVPDDRAKETEDVSNRGRNQDERNRRQKIERLDHIDRLDHVRPENEIDDRLRPTQ
jgi:hypothetical protein